MITINFPAVERQVNTVPNIKQMTEQAIKLNNNRLLINKKGIIRIFGISINKVNEATADIPRVGGKSTYYIGDVVEAVQKIRR